MLSSRRAFRSLRQCFDSFESLSLGQRILSSCRVRLQSTEKFHDLDEKDAALSDKMDLSLFGDSALEEMRKAASRPSTSSSRDPRPSNSYYRGGPRHNGTFDPHRAHPRDRSSRQPSFLASREGGLEHGNADASGKGGNASLVEFYNSFSTPAQSQSGNDSEERHSYRGFRRREPWLRSHDIEGQQQQQQQQQQQGREQQGDRNGYSRPSYQPSHRGADRYFRPSRDQQHDQSGGSSQGLDGRGNHRSQGPRDGLPWSKPDGAPSNSYRRKRWDGPSDGGDAAPPSRSSVRTKGRWNERDDDQSGLPSPSKAQRNSAQQQQQQPPSPAAPLERVSVVLTEPLTLRRLAETLRVSVEQAEDLVRGLDERPRSAEDLVSMESCALLLMEAEHCDVTVAPRKVAPESLRPRNPVVAVMGHVDHGKTSLLDALRSTAVAQQEAGGITQHIGAFEARLPDSHRSITFLDTPGHKAFSALRSRGAKVTDVCVLVVAADDGVMPQTKEALQFARAAGVPIVVALTKVDKREANPARVKQQLLAEGLELEEFGGDVMLVETAAPSGVGIKELEEALVLQADLMDLKASEEDVVKAWVVESRLDRGLGPVATVIVKAGAVKVGDWVVIGPHMGRVKALRSVQGGSTKVLHPGHAAELAGLRGLPTAGDELVVCTSEERAKRLAAARARKEQLQRVRVMQEQQGQGTAGEEGGAVEKSGRFGQREGVPRTLNLVVKADVQGSLEALEESLHALSAEEVPIKILATGLGPVSDADVALAAAGPGHVLAFNVAHYADAAAEKTGVTVAQSRVIYRLLEDVQRMQDALAPSVEVAEPSGQAQVIRMFEIRGAKKSDPPQRVAGCKVTEGAILSTSAVLSYRVVRSGEVLWEGPLKSLRHLQQEREEVKAGTECGVLLEGFQEFLPGDQLVCVVRKMKPVALTRAEEAF